MLTSEYLATQFIPWMPMMNHEPVVCEEYKCEGRISDINNNNFNEVLCESYELYQMEDAVQIIYLVNNEMFQKNYTGTISESVEISNSTALQKWIIV